MKRISRESSGLEYEIDSLAASIPTTALEAGKAT